MNLADEAIREAVLGRLKPHFPGEEVSVNVQRCPWRTDQQAESYRFHVVVGETMVSQTFSPEHSRQAVAPFRVVAAAIREGIIRARKPKPTAFFWNQSIGAVPLPGVYDSGVDLGVFYDKHGPGHRLIGVRPSVEWVASGGVPANQIQPGMRGLIWVVRPDGTIPDMIPIVVLDARTEPRGGITGTLWSRVNFASDGPFMVDHAWVANPG